VPVSFPSHQGLILPLWRRYPRHIDAVALSVGAITPDVVEWLSWLWRRDMSQWAGHSLVGIPLLCVPLGWALSRLARRLLPRAALERLNEGAPDPPETALRSCASVAIGALSHLFFDLISHGNMVLFWPWHRSDHAYPAWWTTPWAEVPLPIYAKPYVVAPYTVAWVALSALGAWLFVRCLRRVPGPRA